MMQLYESVILAILMFYVQIASYCATFIFVYLSHLQAIFGKKGTKDYFIV